MTEDSDPSRMKEPKTTEVQAEIKGSMGWLMKDAIDSSYRNVKL